MSKQILIGIRDQFQSLLDNYLVSDVAMTVFKNALVELNSVIETPEAPAVAVQQPVISLTDIVSGVTAGLGSMQANVIALSAQVSDLSAQVAALAPK